jgi:hypothetical protein
LESPSFSKHFVCGFEGFQGLTRGARGFFNLQIFRVRDRAEEDKRRRSPEAIGASGGRFDRKSTLARILVFVKQKGTFFMASEGESTQIKPQVIGPSLGGFALLAKTAVTVISRFLQNFASPGR